MLQAEQVEELIKLIAALDRATVTQQLQSYRANFPIDFTSEFLQTQSTEQLRHLLLAICLQSQKMPELPTAA